ncbi:ATP-binding protein [Azospirillum sp. A39]|uniref:ATP-binding protein n=1 Tax=Azospirillum sp. A39 TaxID=3462279 RepID=UPI0040455381
MPNQDGPSRDPSHGRRPAPAAGPEERRAALHAAVFAGTGQLVVAADATGAITDVNPAAERLLGHSRADLAGRPLSALHDPGELAAEAERVAAELGTAVAPGLEALLAMARRGLANERDWTYLGKDGGRLPVRSSVSALRGGDGRLIGFVAIATDLTERRAHERALSGARGEAVARRAAEGESVAKTRFLAAASHDLRQPLQSAVLFASALLPHVTVGRGLEVLGRLEKSLEALRALLDRLLDISKLDGGAVLPRRAAIPLARLLAELDEAYAPRAAARGLGWSVVACDATVLSDPELLGRILRNLIENALRYTPCGSVTLAATVEDGAVALRVIDTGIGIPEGSLDAIFQEFHRVPGTGEADALGERGLGLGLAIVRRLAALLNHSVAVESRPGAGSTFTVRVPLAATHVPAAPPAAEPPAVMPPAPEGGGRLVLVVEDDSLVCGALVAMIRQWGYETLDAASAAEAEARLGAAAPRRPDVVLADYRLRDGLTGAALLRALTARYDPPPRAVLLTGETGVAPLQEVGALGCQVLHKPVAAAALRRVLAGKAP